MKNLIVDVRLVVGVDDDDWTSESIVAEAVADAIAECVPAVLRTPIVVRSSTPIDWEKPLRGLDDAPRRIREKALEILALLDEGAHFRALGGKTMHRDPARASVPVGLRWRLWGRVVKGKFVAEALLSHEAYNHET